MVSPFLARRRRRKPAVGDTAITESFIALLSSSTTADKGSNATPTVESRASAAYRPSYSGGAVAWESVASGVIRVASSRKSADATPKLLTGALIEPETTDHYYYDNTWTNLVAATSALTGTSPDGQSCYAVTETTATSTHRMGITTGGSALTNGNKYSLHFFIKPGLREIFALNHIGGWGCPTCRFNFDTLTIDRNDSDGDGFIEDIGNGWYKAGIRNFTSTASVQPAFWLYIYESDSYTASYSGDDSSPACEIWNIGCEENSFETSVIGSNGGAATSRLKDELQYEGNGNLGSASPNGLTIYCETLIRSENNEGGYLWQISDGGSAADSIYLTVEATTGVARVRSAATAGSAGDVTGTTDIADGKVHAIMVTIEGNSLRLFVDEIEEGTEDTSVTMPDDLDEFDIAMSSSGASQLSGIISNVRVWPAALPDTTVTPSWTDA